MKIHTYDPTSEKPLFLVQRIAILVWLRHDLKASLRDRQSCSNQSMFSWSRKFLSRSFLWRGRRCLSYDVLNTLQKGFVSLQELKGTLMRGQRLLKYQVRQIGQCLAIPWCGTQCIPRTKSISHNYWQRTGTCTTVCHRMRTKYEHLLQSRGGHRAQVKKRDHIIERERSKGSIILLEWWPQNSS